MQVDHKPLVYVIGTGGSISFIGGERTDFINYSYADRHYSIDELLERIPEVQAIARIRAEQFLNVGSPDITLTHWLELARRINRVLRDDPAVAGIAITHGTATLEETAYFLNLVIKHDRPVVITGAMRPPTALSTDADLNLLDTVRVAACPEARGKGVLVVLNNEIQAAREVTKTNTYRLETFQTADFGFLGYADADQQVVFYRAPTRPHTSQTEFDVEGLTELPRVDIVYAYTGADDLLIRALVDADVPGIVAAGLGSGGSPPAFMQGLRTARTRGTVVVVSSQTGSGRVVPTRRFQEEGWVVADNLTPKKARVLLMLALTVTRDLREIQRMMAQY
ncbi:MAG: asparaginase [Nitrospinae bacterium]|nr:asparaginase [Nitrospinota bacterium]